MKEQVFGALAFVIALVLVASSGVQPAAAQSLSTPRVATSAACVPPPAVPVSWWPGDGNASDVQGSNDGKLGVNSRAGATRYASEHGLV